MPKKPSTAIFVGRFQPLHVAHQATIAKALEECHSVIVCVGSAFKAPDTKNPFPYEYRKQMIHDCFPDEYEKGQLRVIPLRDHLYSNFHWIAELQRRVEAEIQSLNDHYNMPLYEKVVFFGRDKDASSSYLRWFDWPFVDSEIKIDGGFIHATTYRDDYLSSGANMDPHLPVPVRMVMGAFALTEDYRKLRDDYHVLQNYKRAWKDSPYPPIFTTVDAVVTKVGHILLVERKDAPGKGLLALPGGFVNANETLRSGVLRELLEETSLRVQVDFLESRTPDIGVVFDAPGRSLRGRTITHAYRIDLDDGKPNLPTVAGGDDAAKALWVSLNELHNMETRMFEDHLHIINKLVNSG